MQVRVGLGVQGQSGGVGSRCGLGSTCRFGAKVQVRAGWGSGSECEFGIKVGVWDQGVVLGSTCGFGANVLAVVGLEVQGQGGSCWCVCS